MQVMSFQTTGKSGVLFGVECISDMDYLAIFLISDHSIPVEVSDSAREGASEHEGFDLGSRTYSIASNEQIADGEKHVIKYLYYYYYK